MQGGQERALRMVFLGHRCAEQREDSVSSGLRDVAAIALHGLHHQVECRIDYGAGFLRIEVLYELHRSFDVREQCSDGLAFTLKIFKSGCFGYPNLRLLEFPWRRRGSCSQQRPAISTK